MCIISCKNFVFGKFPIHTQVRTKMASGCYSDHLLLLKAFAGWQEALQDNQEFVYIRENFLHRGSLRMIEGVSEGVW